MAGSKTMSKRVKTVSKASAGGGDRLFSRRQERNDYSDSASESSEPEKDEIEQDLEKLIFGDQQGFLDALKQKSSSKGKELVLGQGGIGVDGELSQDEDLEDVADENLFFLDSGPGAIPSGISASLPTAAKDNGDQTQTDRGSWWDSDDDRILVSLASNSRLRKLRDTEAEDVVSGREYITRLRRQFERLHPKPAWASRDIAGSVNARKRRRRDSERDIHISGEESNDDYDDAGLSSLKAQPLAELLRSSDALIDTSRISRSSRFKLRPEVIDIHRLKDVTSSSPSAITGLSFHERYPILLATAGPASTVFLHHVSPHSLQPNPLLTSLMLKRTPLQTVEFRHSRKVHEQPQQQQKDDDTQIFLSSRRRFMHTWQLSTGQITRHTRPIYGNKIARASQRTLESFHLSPCGRYIAFIGSSRKGGGVINVLDASTMQWLCACRVEGRGGVADFHWWTDGDGLAVLSKSGEVNEFSVEERRIIARWTDEGNVGPTTLVIGGKSGKRGSLLGPDRWVIIGSTSGIVNIYDRTSWGHEPEDPSTSSTVTAKNSHVPTEPRPTRTLEQLTTPVSNLAISPDGQLLVVSSRWKRDAVRLVHLPSCTVYRNWPTSSTPLGRVTSISLTSWGGSKNTEASGERGIWLCIGNEKGRIGMWEVRA